MNRNKLIATLQQVKALVDESLAELGHDGRESESATPRAKKDSAQPAAVSFNMNILAFMNKYARGLKGPQKFTLLLARLTKGKPGDEVTRAVVKNHWNKMKLVLGGKFNPAHANRAKARGWVDSPKHGIYTLSDSWKECLTRK